jgi:hypothetical protein
MEDYFSNFYYSPENVFNDPNRIWQVIKKDMQYKTIKYKKRDFLKWVLDQKEYQVNKTNILPHDLHTIIAPNDSYQMDITFYDQYSRLNKGYSCILTIIEITSRKAYAYPMKSKKAEEVLENFKTFHDEVKKIAIIEVDAGNEFINNKFQKYCTDNDIKLLIFNNDKKSMGKVERFNRTIRDSLSKIAPDGVWIDKVPIIVHVYNNTKHSSTKYTPQEVSVDKTKLDSIRTNEMVKGMKAKDNLQKFNVGDKVRYYINRDMFSKGKGRYSQTVHTVESIENNSIYISGKTEPFRFYELLKINAAASPPESIEKPNMIAKAQEDKLNTVTRKMNLENLRDQDVNMKEYREVMSDQLSKIDNPRPQRDRKISEKGVESNISQMMDAQKRNRYKALLAFA